MNIEEFKAWYMTLADSDKLIFLPLSLAASRFVGGRRESCC